MVVQRGSRPQKLGTGPSKKNKTLKLSIFPSFIRHIDGVQFAAALFEGGSATLAGRVV